MANEEAGGIPPWVQFIRTDLSSMEGRINSRLDKMVSTDLFIAEQKRVDGRFKDLQDDVTAANAAAAHSNASVAAERDARMRAETETARVESQQQKNKEEQTARNRWTLLGLVATIIISPVFAAIITFIINGGLATP